MSIACIESLGAFGMPIIYPMLAYKLNEGPMLGAPILMTHDIHIPKHWHLPGLKGVFLGTNC